MQFLFLRQIGRLGNIGMLFWHKNVAQASDLSQKVGWNVARSAYLDRVPKVGVTTVSQAD